MENLRRLRTAAGLTQKALAEKVGNGITQTQIYCYEYSNYFPSYETLIRLADILNTTVDYLIGRSNNPYQFETISESSLTVNEQSIIYQYRNYKDSKRRNLEMYMETLKDDK